MYKPLLLGLLAWCFTVLFSTVLSPLVFAQETSITTVTASVPDNAGPSTPILISPNNGSYVADSTPNFVWRASTDANGIGKYVLTLDGSTLFDNIPTTTTDNAQYTLTYNAINTEYTLTPKAVIANGTHTWKVRAVDTLNNGTDSATWSFTIDSLAPSFVLTALGDATTSISAQDISTIPTSPLILQNNSPLLVANGEAASSVSVVLTIPGNPTQNYQTSISAGGNWSLQLGLLPRDLVMTLDFTITDLAGNVSILQGVEFLIESDVIVFPPVSPSPSPSPSPDSSPDSIGGVSPSPSPSTSPVVESSPLPQPSPLISIPILPPEEIANNFVQEVIKLIPAPITQLVRALPEEVIEVIREAAPVSALLVSAALPAASAIAIGSQFGGSLSLSIFVRILQALGLLPTGKPQGLVFNSQTYQPVPFALLTITNPGSKQTPVLETVVTDVFGVYRGVRLPPDTYQISASHQDFTFPSKQTRLSFTPMSDFYLGEPFTVQSSDIEQLFLIPVDPIRSDGSISWKSRLRVALTQFAKLSGSLLVPLFLLTGLIAILFPSVWNWILFAIYTVLVVKRATSWFKRPIISGVVIDNLGQPVENAVVRVSLSAANELLVVKTTNAKGEFEIFAKPDKYQLSVTKPEYVWVDEQAALSFYEVDTTQQPQQVLVNMKPAAEIYATLFG